MVKIYTDPRYKLGRKRVKKDISAYLSKRGFSQGYTLNVIFVGRRKMKQIAAKYYKKSDSTLPVLSFSYLESDSSDNKPYQKAEKLIGEIFICYPQGVLLAAERNRKVDDTIITLVKHGIETMT